MGGQDEESNSFMGWPEVLRRTRDIGIILIPVCYAAGYFAWSRAALSLGLGYLPGESSRYLALGVLAILLALSLFIANDLVLSLLEHYERQWKRILVAFLSVPSGATVALAYLLVLSQYGVFQAEPRLWAVTAISGSIVALLQLVVMGYFVPAWVRFIHKDRNEQEELRPKIQKQTYLHCAALSILLGTMLFAIVFLPHTNPEFGGFMPREAEFDIDADQASSILESIYVDGQENSTVRTTVLVWVLYTLDDGYLVRDADGPKANGPLYEIPKHVVVGVQWHD